MKRHIFLLSSDPGPRVPFKLGFHKQCEKVSDPPTIGKRRSINKATKRSRFGANLSQ